MLDLDGFFTSMDFFAAIASIITAILTTLLGDFVNGLFV